MERNSETCPAFDKLRPRACRGELSRRTRNGKSLELVEWKAESAGAVDEPAGDQRLLPEAFRWRAVFRQEMSERDRSIKVNQRSFRSCSSSFCSLRKEVTGLRGGGVDAASAGGVIQPLRTASDSNASDSTGLLVLSGGTISATTRSRSVTSTVSPCAARRTYSLSLFFKTFKPTAFISTNVVSGSYLCQGPRV